MQTAALMNSSVAMEAASHLGGGVMVGGTVLMAAMNGTAVSYKF